MNHELITFEHVQKLAYSACHKRGMREPFDDYVQDAYLIYNRCVEHYDPERNVKFSTYFFRQFTYHLQNLQRKEKRNRELVLKLSYRAEPPHECTELLRASLPVQIGLSTLEEQVFKRLYDGYTLLEISYSLDVSLSTVKRIRQRIKQKASRHRYAYV